VIVTGTEAVAVGRRLISAIESAMMETAPGDLLGLLELRFEREAAVALLGQTERRASVIKRVEAESWRGTRLHARWWPQIDVGARFGG
jgi:hypothetical protein